MKDNQDKGQQSQPNWKAKKAKADRTAWKQVKKRLAIKTDEVWLSDAELDSTRLGFMGK